VQKLTLRFAFLTLLGFSMPTFAGISDVSFIEVFSAVPTWLQESEVVATQSGTGTDVALATNGATATNFGGMWNGGDSPAFAIDGIYPASFPQIYHSSGNPADFLKITLASPATLSSVSIYGRTDCCSERDIYNVMLFNQQGELLYQVANLDATNASHFATINLPVPEPETYAMMMVGLGIMGAVVRRKKQQA